MAAIPGAAAVLRAHRGTSARLPMSSWTRLSAVIRGLTGVLLLTAPPVDAASNKVRITDLADVSFGNISDLSGDAVQSQSLCLFSDTASSGYNVTAAGSGPAGAFQLTAGSQALPYEVQWSGAPNRTSGTRLDPNLPLTGQVSTASHQTCNNGPASSASVIVILRAAALSSALAGSYSGTLTLLVGPE